MSDPEPRPANIRPESYAWPLITMALIIAPQVAIPEDHRIGPPLLVPITEIIVLLVMLVIAGRPGPVPRRAHPLVLALFGVLVVANAGGAVRLVTLVLDIGTSHGSHYSATRLLTAGAIVLGTNVVTFGLLYWQLDGGGPAARIAEPPPYPDFQFPQTSTKGLAPPGWRPMFADYLYVAFTNIVAFSPTDAMPLTRRTKGLMALQAIISASVLVVVLARVINILPA
jgi:uncharacterized membrane protein